MPELGCVGTKAVVEGPDVDPGGDVAEPKMVVVGPSPIGPDVGDDGPPPCSQNVQLVNQPMNRTVR